MVVDVQQLAMVPLVVTNLAVALAVVVLVGNLAVVVVVVIGHMARGLAVVVAVGHMARGLARKLPALPPPQVTPARTRRLQFLWKDMLQPLRVALARTRWLLRWLQGGGMRMLDTVGRLPSSCAHAGTWLDGGYLASTGFVPRERRLFALAWR